MSAVQTAWGDLQARVRKMETLGEIRGLLEWDQLTQMPPRAAASRGDQAAVLAGLVHQELTHPAFGDLLDVLEAEPSDDPVQSAGVANLRRLHDRAVRVPPALVQELERAKSLGYQAWIDAREARSYAVFEPALAEMVRLARAWSACIGQAGDHPYDALLDEYEHGARVREVRPLLERLAAALKPLADAILGHPPPPPPSWSMPLDAQVRLCQDVSAALGFDFAGGRLDTSVHPFTVGMSPGDVRITTRFDEARFLVGLRAVMHETGHALYEQGLPPSLKGTGAGGASGMGLHESQSRFWENAIGGSMPFQRWLVGRIRAVHPQMDIDADGLYRAFNRVVPNLIRIDADEVTYNLHILVRFRLEVSLFEGSLSTRDLQEAWNAASADLLGLTPPDPVVGILQDVHWSEGLFRYFPTYTLGNLYAAGLAAAMADDIPDLCDQVEHGTFRPALDWLRTRIHGRASLATTGRIVRDAVGDLDLVEALVSGLWQRHGALHGVSRPAGGLTAGLP